MENQLEYSFDDEYATKFCYDIYNNKIKIHFRAYYDLIKNERINKPCIWTIEKWTDAKSKLGDENRRYDLNYHIGIFSLILYFNYNENNEFEMLVNTIDERYITLYFKEPQIELIEIS